MTNSFTTHSLAVKDSTTKTIASGVITIDQFYHVVAAQTGTSDDLDTINLGYDSLSFNSITYRPILALIADSGDTITLKHGTGNIDLPDDTDVILTDDSHVWMIYNGTNWIAFKAIVSTTSVTASQVGMATLGTPTYSTVQDWANMQSAGMVSNGGISDNGDGSVTVAAGTGRIKTTDSNVGAVAWFDWAEDTNVALTDTSDNWVYVDYNAGVPIVNATTDWLNLDLHTQIIIGRAYRNGTELHIGQFQQFIDDVNRSLQQFLWEKDGVVRTSGISLSETGTRNFAISAGVLYASLNRILFNAVDTSVADTFIYFYRDGIGGWTEVGSSTQIDNTYWDDGTGTLNTLTALRYGVHWVYTAHDGKVYVQYGQGDYTLAQAEAALIPTPPPELASIGVLVGRIIIQQGASSFTLIESAFSQIFTGTTVSDHGALAGLADDDHAQYVLKSGRSGGQTLIGGTGAGDDLTLQTTSNVSKGSYILSELSTDGPVIATGSGGVLATEATLAHERGGLEADVSAYAGYPKISGGATSEVTTIPIADGGTGQTAKTAAFDALSPVTTTGDIIYRDASNNARLAIGTAAQVLTVNAGATAPEWANASGSGLYSAVAILADEKASGTSGGSASATTWNARALNTELSDTGGIVTIASNQFTPIAGNYHIFAYAPAFKVDGHRLRLYNVTGATMVDEGNNINSSAADNTATLAILDIIFSTDGTNAYRIDHYTTAAQATNGLGTAFSLGTSENYLHIELRKLA